MYAKEHDVDGDPWIGHPDGGGWPIFREGCTIPTFDQLRFEPRTHLQQFQEIEVRAEYYVKKWEGLLRNTAGLSGNGGPSSNHRRRYTRAIHWWRAFLAEHKQKFPQGGEDLAGAALAVDEGGPRSDIDLLPLVHEGEAVDLGPIEERCGAHGENAHAWEAMTGRQLCAHMTTERSLAIAI